MINSNKNNYRFGRFVVVNTSIVATVATLFVKMEISKHASHYSQMNVAL